METALEICAQSSETFSCRQDKSCADGRDNDCADRCNLGLCARADTMETLDNGNSKD